MCCQECGGCSEELLAVCAGDAAFPIGSGWGNCMEQRMRMMAMAMGVVMWIRIGMGMGMQVTHSHRETSTKDDILWSPLFPPQATAPARGWPQPGGPRRSTQRPRGSPKGHRALPLPGQLQHPRLQGLLGWGRVPGGVPPGGGAVRGGRRSFIRWRANLHPPPAPNRAGRLGPHGDLDRSPFPRGADQGSLSARRDARRHRPGRQAVLSPA